MSQRAPAPARRPGLGGPSGAALGLQLDGGGCRLKCPPQHRAKVTVSRAEPLSRLVTPGAGRPARGQRARRGGWGGEGSRGGSQTRVTRHRGRLIKAASAPPDNSWVPLSSEETSPSPSLQPSPSRSPSFHPVAVAVDLKSGTGTGSVGFSLWTCRRAGNRNRWATLTATERRALAKPRRAPPAPCALRPARRAPPASASAPRGDRKFRFLPRPSAAEPRRAPGQARAAPWRTRRCAASSPKSCAPTAAA